MQMQNKQSGLSPSFCTLLNVTLCCPDYCRLLLLFGNNTTIPFVWGSTAVKCSAAQMEEKMYEKYVF